MLIVDALDAEARFDEPLDLVQRGVVVLITRRGQVIAQVEPAPRQRLRLEKSGAD